MCTISGSRSRCDFADRRALGLVAHEPPCTALRQGDAKPSRDRITFYPPRTIARRSQLCACSAWVIHSRTLLHILVTDAVLTPSTHDPLRRLAIAKVGHVKPTPRRSWSGSRKDGGPKWLSTGEREKVKIQYFIVDDNATATPIAPYCHLLWSSSLLVLGPIRVPNPARNKCSPASIRRPSSGSTKEILVSLLWY